MYCLMLGCRYHYFSKFVKYAYPWCPFFHTSNANSCIYIFLVSFGVHGVCKSCISFWGVFHSLFSFFFLFFSCLNEFFFFLRVRVRWFEFSHDQETCLHSTLLVGSVS